MSSTLRHLHQRLGRFKVPAGSRVWPVWQAANDGHRWAAAPVLTNKDSSHTQVRHLPTDGRFRIFSRWNERDQTAYTIVMFETPIARPGTSSHIIGFVVDLNTIMYDLPF